LRPDTDPKTDIYTLLAQKRGEILSLAHRRGARNVRIFGSVRGMRPGQIAISDILIDLDPRPELLDVGGLAIDLSALLSRQVDVVTEAGARGANPLKGRTGSRGPL